MEENDGSQEDSTSQVKGETGKKILAGMNVAESHDIGEMESSEGNKADGSMPNSQLQGTASGTSTGGEKMDEDEVGSHGDEEPGVIAKEDMEGTPEEVLKNDDDVENVGEEVHRLGREGEFTSEIYKIMLKNLPKRFGFQQLKKMLDGLQLKPRKIKAVQRKDYAFITFACEEDRQRAMEILNKHTWKGRKLSTKIAKALEDPMVALKRKQENQGGNEKRKRDDPNPDEDLPIEERLNNAVTPLWKQDYKEQLVEKYRIKRDLIQKLSSTLFNEIPDIRSHLSAQRKKNDGLCCPLEEIKPSPIITGYRNKCEFSIGTNLEGEEKTVGFRLGLYRGGQISVVNPSACPNVPETSKAVVQSFQTYIRMSELAVYDPITHYGHWRMLTVRTTQGSGSSGVMAMVTFHRQSLTEDEVNEEKKKLAEFFGAGEGRSCGVTSLFIHVQWKGDKNAIKFDHIYGDEHITENLLQLKFRISPQAFFQVNTPAAEVLYTTIGDWAQVNKTTTLLDICCGTGTIGISLAQRVEKVIGVEMNAQAVEDAKENAAINGVDNVTFHCGKAENLLPDITNKLHGCLDVVGIVDPPRAGLHQRVVQAIRRCPKLNRLVYVSCDAKQASTNFVNLCRSMSKKQRGVPFTLVKAIPVDLFPHTIHCELILLFERNLSRESADNGSSL